MCLPEMPVLIAHRSRVAGPTGRPGGLLWLLSWTQKKDTIRRWPKSPWLARPKPRHRKPEPAFPLLRDEAERGLESSVDQDGKQALLILLFNPVEARQAGGANTRRAARTMRDVSGRYMDVPSGNALSDCGSVPRSGTDGPTGWPSLVTFLATQESDPRNARNAVDPTQNCEASTS